MEDMLKIAGLCVLTSLMALTLRKASRQTGAVVVLCAGVMLLTFSVTHLKTAVDEIRRLTDQAQLPPHAPAVLFKMLGLTFVTETAVQMCRDTGEESLAQKAGMAGKILLLGQMLPIISDIFQMMKNMIP